MIRNENAGCWVDCWNAVLPKSGNVPDEVQAARWNERADHFARNIEGERRQKKAAEVLAFLGEAGFSPQGSKILDIGCGPGTLSLPFARAGAEVTSLDISSGMLGRLKEIAENEALRIETLECSWWTADIDALGLRNRFDLVFASSTPAVKDVETFDRMMACSRNYCYYSGFVRRNPDTARSEMFRKILGREEDPHGRMTGPGLLYPFMYLYTMGYRPLIRFGRNARAREHDWPEAAEHTIESQGNRQELSEESREKIREWYKNASPDGKYRSGSEMFSGMMIWNVR